jgi:hypothetical protein
MSAIELHYETRKKRKEKGMTELNKIIIPNTCEGRGSKDMYY